MVLVKIHLIFLFLFSFAFGSLSFAQAPVVGRKAAEKWLQKNEPSQEVSRSPDQEDSSDSFLAIHLGGFVSSTSYAWAGGTRENPARSTYGVTYLFEEWGRMDLSARIDFNEFHLGSERPRKLSVLPLLTFPAADTKFPLYFGFGAGLGIFFKQVQDESSLSLDYQLVVGARLFELYESMGAFVEYGMKNHIHLFSDGQLNATHLTAGLLFTF